MPSRAVSTSDVADARASTSPSLACRASSAGRTTAFQPPASDCSDDIPSRTCVYSASAVASAAASTNSPPLSEMVR